jgi:hypothetical protein
VSSERIRISPEPTQQEAEAVRQALAALGLIESSPPEGEQAPGDADREP